jgi:hypothetical protein
LWLDCSTETCFSPLVSSLSFLSKFCEFRTIPALVREYDRKDIGGSCCQARREDGSFNWQDPQAPPSHTCVFGRSNLNPHWRSGFCACAPQDHTTIGKHTILFSRKKDVTVSRRGVAQELP